MVQGEGKYLFSRPEKNSRKIRYFKSRDISFNQLFMFYPINK